MKSREWEQVWQDKHIQEEWITPEPDIIAFINTLRNENVRKVLDLGFGIG